MQLRKLIGEIGAKHDPQSPTSSEAWRPLRKAEAEFSRWIPSGYLVEVNGGKGKSATTPRIAILNPAETTTTRRGMYVAYLFAADNSTVTLTLNQGVGEMAEFLGRAGARMVLALEATTIRAALRPKDIADLDIAFDLHTTAGSSVDHQHANIVSRTYSLDSLTSESKMQADLQRFLGLYALAIEAREVAQRNGRHEMVTPARQAAAKSTAKKSLEPEAAPATRPAAKKSLEPEAAPATRPAAKKSLEPEAGPAKSKPKKAAKKAAEPDPATKPASPVADKGPAEPRIAESAESDTAKSDAAKSDVAKSDAAKSDAAQKDPAPEIRMALSHQTLARPTSRRGLLAALVAAPFAYMTPAAAASWKPQTPATNTNLSAITPLPRPAETAPVFTVDVSQHDWGRRGGNLDWVAIRQAGIAGMCARATYGDPSGYHWPTYHFGDFARAAKNAGMGLRGGYHNLVRGDQESINRQVDWLRRELDRHDAYWAMLDIERYSELIKAEMWPRWEDVRRFDDRWAQVESRVLVGYLPPWNWSKHLGQPDLRDFRGPLIASNYPLNNANEDFKQLYERVGGNRGPGWATYGNRTPEGWQYSSKAKVPGAPYICDINAWRLNFEQLRALLLGLGRPARRADAQPDT